MEGYFSDSILKRAINQNLIEIDYHTPRDFSENKWKKTDEYMIGGGAGLLMTPQPVDSCISSIRTPDSKVIFLVPAGKPFRQNDSKRLASESHIVLVTSRYEGVDERLIEKHADEVFSIGDYVLTGGELPAMVMCDAISRHVPGVLGNADSLACESFEQGLLEAPSFTKPNVYEKRSFPSEFLKGNHSIIRLLKKRLALQKTRYFRPELYVKQLFKDT